MANRRLPLVLGALAACAHSAAPPASAPVATPSAPAAPAPATAPTDAAGVLAQFKAATGGARWDAVTSIASKGTLAAGGLTGTADSLTDARTGYSVAHFKLGPVTGAEGFDGKTSWQVTPGGEVIALDAPDAKELARTGAWMNAMGYWYPDRGHATYGPVRTEEASGKPLRIFTATPDDGRAIDLGFDASGLLVRSTQRQGADTVITLFDDYRDVSGVRVPFRFVTDRTDAAGRTDPRNHQEVQIESTSLNAPVAEGAFAMPQMAPAARITDPSGQAKIPIEIENNHIFASGTIDGKPVRFIVDTGGLNLLTPAAAERLGVKSEGKLAAGGVGDERVDLSIAHVGEVRLGGAVLEKPVFFVIDLGPLSAAEGRAEDGLVGFEMFRRFRVTVDYAAHALTLTDPAKFTPPAKAAVVPFEMSERTPIVTGTLDGLPVRLTIDTGSRSSLTLHSPFVKEHDLVAKYGAAPETVTGWGVGGPSRARPARLGTLQLGEVAIRDIAGDLYLGQKGAFADPDLSGNLGGGILRRFTVTFDYDQKKMYLLPNKEFAKPDPFDRSGLWLFSDGKTLKVVAVAPESPAEKAGIAVDDQIEKINGEAVGKQQLTEWRRWLRELPVGTKLKLTTRRGGAERTADLVLADLIPEHAKVK
jgi:predicted aspartyl protease